MHLVLFRHDDTRCALPLAQVLSADIETSQGGELWLFHEEEQQSRRHENAPRYLRVLGKNDLLVPCSEVRVQDIQDASVYELTPLVRAAIALPHVRAIVELEDGPAWLLDLTVVARS
jgi:hypothetical protein